MQQLYVAFFQLIKRVSIDFAFVLGNEQTSNGSVRVRNKVSFSNRADFVVSDK